MLTRRRAICGAGCLLLPLHAMAQDAADDPPPALKAAVAAYVDAWNSRDTARLGALIADDVEWVFIYTSVIRRGRQAVMDYAATAISVYAVDLRVFRVKASGDEAIALLRGRFNEYPLRDGKYTRVWERDVLFTRWRQEAGGWRLAFMNENATQSAELAKAAGL